MGFWTWLGFFLGPLPQKGSADPSLPLLPVGVIVPKRKKAVPGSAIVKITSGGFVGFKLSEPDPVASVLALCRKLSIGATSYPSSPMVPGNPRPIMVHPYYVVGHVPASAGEMAYAFSKAGQASKYPGTDGKWLASWLVWAAQVQGKIKDYIPGPPFKEWDAPPIWWKGEEITIGKGLYAEKIIRVGFPPKGWDTFYKAWHDDWAEMGGHGFKAIQIGQKIVSSPSPYGGTLTQHVPINGWVFWPNTQGAVEAYRELYYLPDIRPIVMGLLVPDPVKWKPVRYSGPASAVPRLPLKELAEMDAAAREYAAHWASWSGQEQGLLPSDSPGGVVERVGLCLIGVVAVLVGTWSSWAKYGMQASDLSEWLNDMMFQGNQLGGHDFDFTSMGAVADSMIEMLGHILAEKGAGDWVEELADWVGDVVELLIG